MKVCKRLTCGGDSEEFLLTGVGHVSWLDGRLVMSWYFLCVDLAEKERRKL